MILMIDNYDSFTYNIVQEFGMLGADVRVVKNDAIDCAGIAALRPTALVFSPGPGNPDTAGVTLAAVKAFAGKVPLLGICLGHQSIAQAFGGRIVGAKRLMHGKTSQLKHDGRGLFRGFPLATDQKTVARRSLWAAEHGFTVFTPDLVSTLHRIVTSILPHRLMIALSNLWRHLAG